MPEPTQGKIVGIGVSAGRAVGPVAKMPDPLPEPPAVRLDSTDDAELAAGRITRAAVEVRAGLEIAAGRTHGPSRDVLEATAAMAADPTLVRDAVRRVTTQRLVPERAVWEAAASLCAEFSALGGRVAERVRDIEDVRDRLVAALTGRTPPGLPERGEPYVLVAHDLAPSQTAALDPATVLAIATEFGGPTSHTAILARELDIPAVVAVPGLLGAVADGDTLVVDGACGTVLPHPGPEQVRRAASWVRTQRTFDGLCATRDGRAVELLANIGDPRGALTAKEVGASGIGLLRTEFCFLDRAEEPSVPEQVAEYRRVLAAFPAGKVVIRTLDTGADKPLSFAPARHEPNPALGLRGVRTGRRFPDLLEHQLAAIAEASAREQAEVWVMAPMVTTVAEAEDFVAACTRHGLPRAGVMIEVPSAALLADAILRRAAFASIGTNDLTQYTLAADRDVGELADLTDSWHPAVLSLIAMTCAGGARQGRPVSVCGEAAADPVLAPVLVGLGAVTLSMTARALPDVAAVLRATTMAECQAAAELALAAESAADARAVVRDRLSALDELGL